MRGLVRGVIAALVLFAGAALAAGQEPPPPIGPFVLDAHGTVPRFPSDIQLSQSRNLSPSELPGVGLGLHAGAHVYPLRWRNITFGLGADVTLARAHRTPPSGQSGERAVTERFAHVAPQLSFNFGTGNGWSYLSGGIGPSVWALGADSEALRDADVERLGTINYGGGARWFLNAHLAFSFDVRFYAIDPGTPADGLPGSPRTTLLFIGAGVSIK
jgi:hypothetical protein